MCYCCSCTPNFTDKNEYLCNTSNLLFVITQPITDGKDFKSGGKQILMVSLSAVRK